MDTRASASASPGGSGYDEEEEGEDEGGDDGDDEESGSGTQEEERPLQRPPERWIGREGDSSIPHGYDLDRLGPIPSRLALPEWGGESRREGPYVWWPGLTIGGPAAAGYPGHETPARSLPSLRSVFGDVVWDVGRPSSRSGDRGRRGGRREEERSGSAPVQGHEVERDVSRRERRFRTEPGHEPEGSITSGAGGKGKRRAGAGSGSGGEEGQKSKVSRKIAVACDFCRCE